MKPPIKTRIVNLEEGRPRVNEGLLRLDRAIVSAKREGIEVVKLIHGYGSSGVGGRLREEVWNALSRYKRGALIQDFIPGEDFRISNEASWELLKRAPELKQDRDLGNNNRGITVVLL